MAEIKPIAAWRYHPRLTRDIDSLTSPLFDVVSDKQRESLYKHPYNSIHLSVPKGDTAAHTARKTMELWKQNHIIVKDELPAIYVYYQHFSLPGSIRKYCRKGFIANLKIYDWDEKILLRHESTMPFSIEDRITILDETQMNVSPTHGLYTDPGHQIEAYLDECMKCPIYESEDYQGVKDTFGIIQNTKVIKSIISVMKHKQVILADGHHRYGGSLEYKKRKQAQNNHHTGKEGYNYHMMFFTNTESDDLRILPTHRIVRDLPDFSEDWLLEQLMNDFTIKPVDNPPDVNEIILGKKWAFGLLVGENAYKIRLKPERINEIPWNFPDMIKRLDLTVLHYFIFERILGIRGRKQTEAKNITFQRNFTECLREVQSGEAQFALITKDISIDTVKEVCYSGYTLPQKSTYFYPKVINGFLFSSIKDDEFTTPFDTCFE